MRGIIKSTLKSKHSSSEDDVVVLNSHKTVKSNAKGISSSSGENLNLHVNIYKLMMCFRIRRGKQYWQFININKYF